MRALAARILAASVLAAAGCTMPEGHYDGPIHERFPVPEQASTACISAAKLASKWCPPIDKDSYADMVYGTRCNEARWDYARYCR